MKLRLILAALVLGIFIPQVRAQSQCETVSAYQSGDVPNYNAANQYIVSEIVTWTVTCKNSDNNSTTSVANSTSATGQGGLLADGKTFIACNPIFGYSIINPPTVTAAPRFNNVGQDDEYAGAQSNWACFPAAFHINTTSCPIVACGSTPIPPPVPCSTWPCKPGYKRDPATCVCKLLNSPIVLDMNGHGFQLTSAEGGVSFDISGTGTPIQMGWIAAGADNAFLALPGADGLVHSGKQLFGNFTPQPASDTPNGFAALAVYDDPKNGGNGDGIIDSRDAIFASLRLWIDANHDGISQPEELHTLPSLGVNSISLKYKASEKTDVYGNVFRYRARVNPNEATDVGKTAYDVFFVDLSPTTKNNKCDAPVGTKKGGMLSVGR